MKKKNVAVILAGGRGLRSGFTIPKQMMKLAGKPLVEHTIHAFQKSIHIDEIIIVTGEEWIDRMSEIVSSRSFNKVTKIINGGNERYESSLAAINACDEMTQNFDVRLIFHDAVRPLVNERIIRDVVMALDHYNAVDVVVPTTDTIICANSITNTIDTVPERNMLRNGQTPQGFSYYTIKRAYEIALGDPNFKTTDDCGVVLRYLSDEKIYLVEGDTNNIKLTYSEDLPVIDKLLQLNSKKVISDSLNSNKLSRLKNKVVVIVGGTSGIGQEMAVIAEAYQAKVVRLSRRTGTDITNVKALSKMFEEIRGEYGSIDFVVNTAGILMKQALVLMNYKDVIDSINVNYVGAVNVSLVAFKFLRESKGQLLNFTSSSYTYGRSYYSLYSSSKAAVVNLTQALAEEWHPHFIRVNCINPERTNTPMRKRAFGIEPEETLLLAEDVALFSLGVLLNDGTGQVFDITQYEVSKARNNVNYLSPIAEAN